MNLKVPNWKMKFPIRDFSFFCKKIWVYVPNNILLKYNTMKTVASEPFKIRHISVLTMLKNKEWNFWYR